MESKTAKNSLDSRDPHKWFQPFIGPPHGRNFTASDRPFELYIPLTSPYFITSFSHTLHIFQNCANLLKFSIF